MAAWLSYRLQPNTTTSILMAQSSLRRSTSAAAVQGSVTPHSAWLPTRTVPAATLQHKALLLRDPLRKHLAIGAVESWRSGSGRGAPVPPCVQPTLSKLLFAVQSSVVSP